MPDFEEVDFSRKNLSRMKFALSLKSTRQED